MRKKCSEQDEHELEQKETRRDEGERSGMPILVTCTPKSQNGFTASFANSYGSTVINL